MQIFVFVDNHWMCCKGSSRNVWRMIKAFYLLSDILQRFAMDKLGFDLESWPSENHYLFNDDLWTII